MLFLCSYWSTAPTRRRVPQTERPDELSTVVHIDSLLEIKPADSRERSALIPIFCWFNDLSAANKHFQLTDGDQQTSTAVCSGSLCLTWWVGFYIKPVKPLNERVYFLFSVQTFVWTVSVGESDSQLPHEVISCHTNMWKNLRYSLWSQCSCCCGELKMFSAQYFSFLQLSSPVKVSSDDDVLSWSHDLITWPVSLGNHLLDVESHSWVLIFRHPARPTNLKRQNLMTREQDSTMNFVTRHL